MVAKNEGDSMHGDAIMRDFVAIGDGRPADMPWNDVCQPLV